MQREECNNEKDGTPQIFKAGRYGSTCGIAEQCFGWLWRWSRYAGAFRSSADAVGTRKQFVGIVEPGIKFFGSIVRESFDKDYLENL